MQAKNLITIWAAVKNTSPGGEITFFQCRVILYFICVLSHNSEFLSLFLATVLVSVVASYMLVRYTPLWMFHIFVRLSLVYYSNLFLCSGQKGRDHLPVGSLRNIAYRSRTRWHHDSFSIVSSLTDSHSVAYFCAYLFLLVLSGFDSFSLLY